MNDFGIGVVPVGSNIPITVAMGSTGFDTVTFVNNGNVNWVPGTSSLGGSFTADFSTVADISPSTIAPGMTGTMILKFTPSTAGAESVTIDFPASVPGASLVTGNTIPYTVNANTSASVAQKYAQDGFVLGQSYPNPTTSSADVMVTLPSDASVRLDLLDATGSVVRSAFSGRLSSGNHVLSIDAKELPSGVYYYMLTSGEVRLTRQMVLIK